MWRMRSRSAHTLEPCRSRYVSLYSCDMQNPAQDTMDNLILHGKHGWEFATLQPF